MNGTPRKITSGSATGEPSCSEIVATTMKIPSADSMRRSRSATSAGSPMSTPSTKIIPDCSGSPKLAPRSSMSSGNPLSPPEHVVGVDPDRVGERGVQMDPLVVAVDRHHVARLDEVEHQLQLLGVAVTGGVDRGVGGRDRRHSRCGTAGRRSRTRRARCRGSAWPLNTTVSPLCSLIAGGRCEPSGAAPTAARPGSRWRSRRPCGRASPRPPGAGSGSRPVPRCVRASDRCRRSCASSVRPARPCGRGRRRHRQPAGRGGCWTRSWSR